MIHLPVGQCERDIKKAVAKAKKDWIQRISQALMVSLVKSKAWWWAPELMLVYCLLFQLEMVSLIWWRTFST